MERFADSARAITSSLGHVVTRLAATGSNARIPEESGLPKDLASVLAGTGYLYSSLGIIESQEATGLPLKTVANLYDLGDRLDLTWFANSIAALAQFHWQRGKESFPEDLDWQQRADHRRTAWRARPARCPRAWKPGNRSNTIERWSVLAERRACGSRNTPCSPLPCVSCWT